MNENIYIMGYCGASGNWRNRYNAPTDINKLNRLGKHGNINNA